MASLPGTIAQVNTSSVVIKIPLLLNLIENLLLQRVVLRIPLLLACKHILTRQLPQKKRPLIIHLNQFNIMKKTLLLLQILLMFCSGVLARQVLYVSPAGSASNPALNNRRNSSSGVSAVIFIQKNVSYKSCNPNGCPFPYYL